ncbi:hypothetical protein BHU16_10945 [Tannerella sp. oral taxon 808]|nr:hypothetical protein BHU16_10945 [Tannerella sp. oral taxon 808]
MIFKYTKADTGQDIDWYAGKGIRLNGKLTFNHDEATDHTGFIKLRANTNDSVLWGWPNLKTLVELPGKKAECPHPCGGGVGDIYLNAPVKTIAQHLRVSAQIFPSRYSEHLGRVECLIYRPFLPL